MNAGCRIEEKKRKIANDSRISKIELNKNKNNENLP